MKKGPTPYTQGARQGTRRNRAMSAAAASAIALLRDPEMREHIVRAGSGAAQQLRDWNDERRRADRPPMSVVGPDHPATGRERSRRVAAPIEQRRLERRASRLAQTVTALRSAAAPRVATTFDEMEAAIERINLALQVARNLPKAARRDSLAEVDEVLAAMESAVTDALLGGISD